LSNAVRTIDVRGGPYGATKGVLRCVAVDDMWLMIAGLFVPTSTNDGVAASNLPATVDFGRNNVLVLVDGATTIARTRRWRGCLVLAWKVSAEAHRDR
jgi:hypothetical protein